MKATISLVAALMLVLTALASYAQDQAAWVSTATLDSTGMT